MQSDLAQWGVVPNKTHSVRFPAIPKHLDRHFLRGFLDGDGYINQEAFGWVTNPHMANDLQQVCIEHGFEELKRFRLKHSKSSQTVKGSPRHHEVIKWIYKDASIFLNRKKESFDTYWKDRTYVARTRSYPNTAHIPCTLGVLQPVLGSTLVSEPSTHS